MFGYGCNFWANLSKIIAPKAKTMFGDGVVRSIFIELQHKQMKCLVTQVVSIRFFKIYSNINKGNVWLWDLV